ncbi:MAG: alanine--glyoxylate aminotransferase family protein [Chloroflexi bacterium]|nr:alanine--glyoxylate aminotransferase family protein [Chloroflexota bacterium]
MYKKLFIPGPTHVRDEILQAMATPMIGHRAKDYEELHSQVVPKLQKLLYTNNRVYLFSSSATGVMEGAIRNCVGRRVLNTINGAFAKRWHEIAVANGKETGAIKVDIGQAITPEMVDEELASGQYDAVCVTHNETSTGITNPLGEIAEVVKKYPDVLLLVDSVSGMAGIKIEVDKLGIDVCLASVQKCFALPPGMAVASVSQRALDRAKTIPNRGIYFDFLQMEKYAEKNNTPATPAISHTFALNKQLDDIFAEGLENRFARHAAMARILQDWAKTHFAIYGDTRYASNTVSNVENTRGISVSELNKELAKRGAVISNGYGDLKDKCFRIAHMGDLAIDDMKWLVAQMNDILGL